MEERDGVGERRKRPGPPTPTCLRCERSDAAGKSQHNQHAQDRARVGAPVEHLAHQRVVGVVAQPLRRAHQAHAHGVDAHAHLLRGLGLVRVQHRARRRGHCACERGQRVHADA